MKWILAFIVMILDLGLVFVFICQPSQSWHYIKTEASTTHKDKQYVRMTGSVLQTKHKVTTDTGEETIFITNDMSGPK
ncbi:hypothetical protein HOO54_18055 [Bacillus sp. WMMC1349]|uniref:hypothetical protein n=1 Tax=Bacillus sp. WMMC1349 TaxID=2736254 RepID=UPI001556DF6C|nr:hypothetical protein [Bacillus sp. WMMC1349]NPC94070.1 hypothetical protein [Bacillus sp. WMMC1349]